MSAFRLRKWYLDLVGDDGTAVIAYHATLRRGWLHAGYASLRVCLPDGSARETDTLRSPPEPRVAGGVVEWSCPRLGVDGRWCRDAVPLAETLLHTRAGSVRWTVPAPRAEVTLSLGGKRWTGRGYAELLELDIAPWHLPFHTLHWGRFLGPSDVVVWILWDEGRAGAWVRHNGADAGTIEARAEAFQLGDGCTIALEGRRPLRAGPLTGSLRPLPWPLRRVPRAFRAATEEKWLSRAHTMAGPAGTGWALYERVLLG